MRKLQGRYALLTAPIFSLLCLVVLIGCGKGSSSRPVAQLIYQRTNIIANVAGYVDSAGSASKVDANLVNPWGLATSPSGPFWVADNGAGVATIYSASGSSTSGPVTIPLPTGKTGTSRPTGVVYNGTSGFIVTKANSSASAQFLFATEDGTISGWSPSVDQTNAILAVDRSTAPGGAVYKGLALVSNSSGVFLYATNFMQGKVEVFDKSFTLVNTFTDTQVDAGFAPFGIQNINGNLYVTFAKQDPTKQHDVPGAGNGFIDIFSPSGTLQQRLVSHGKLNSPWGMALAPSGFGPQSGRLLVSNLGDGTINAFDAGSGSFISPIYDGNTTNPITVPGLWALSFGNGGQAGSPTELYFTAGINQGQGGLFGVIRTTALK